VIVFAGGEGDESLLAYEAASGEIAWKGGRGKHSYSSPQLVSVAGKEQLLFLSDVELTSLDPVTGQTLWQFSAGGGVGQPSLQPHLVDSSQILISFNADAGAALVKVKDNDGKWEPSAEWVTRDLKPFFNDFVCYQGDLYGFDGTIFSCVDMET